ncbi:MAG: IS110 family RNA-guided transposase [Caulobacteraceae bacterium]
MKCTTNVAGIDAAKAKLDVAVHGLAEMIQVANGPAGFEELGAWLASHEVVRVGIEATGGYERAVVAWLQAHGFEVVVHQPLEVRLFARLKRRRAKNDRIDARIIAAATVQVDTVKAAADPLYGELAERMTAYEQASDHVARLKACLEQVSLPDLRASLEDQIRQASAWKLQLLKDLVARIKSRDDLARRYALLQSLPGVAGVVAASLVVRMPELGSLSPGEAAALIGVAPFDFDTGQFRGQRHIWGGRARPRRLLYLAALAAKMRDPAMRAFAQRLLDKGKAPKVAIVAVMRKLIIAANLVLQRGTPWVQVANA